MGTIARVLTPFRFQILLMALLLSPGLAVAQEPLASSGPGTVIVEWTTETEVDLAGFNIYRSESLDGPYAKLNATLIPASPDPIAGGSYSYTDAGAEAGVTYYYKLEDVELDGKATIHGPITVVAEGNVVSQVSQAGVLIALLAAGVLVGSAIFVIGRRVSAARERRDESGRRGEP
jgi:hypothetical protein